MKKRYSIIIFAILLLTNNIALASRQLEKDEILAIIKTLTDQPISTWIPYGTIKGTHIEYSVSDGVVIESTEQVKYDGNRFFWEINISSQKHAGDNIPKELARDLKNNAERIFVWDGNRYSMYFATTNNAIVYGEDGHMPVVVNGPLTAGIIPWGHGAYSYERLSTAELSAIENYQEQIVLTVRMENIPEMEFVLDLDNDYATLTHSLNIEGVPVTTKSYSSFETVGNRLIPTSVIIERYNISNEQSELSTRDEWDMTTFNLNLPKPTEFEVPYKKNAFVEFNSPLTNTRLSYNVSDTLDEEQLLQQREEVALTNGNQSQNCATIAIEHIFSQLGKELTSQQLVQLAGADNSTSLYDMRQLALDSDFDAAAVVTDLKTLKKLKDCQIILYLPKSQHYVVLDHIDPEYVWIVDLDSDKFYYRTSLDTFKYLWNDGVALLVSDQSFDLAGLTEIGEDDLKEIIGSTGGGIPNYSCTDPIQDYDFALCPKMSDGSCSGRYWEWEERWGCKEDEGGGYCTGTGMLGHTYFKCKVKDDLTGCEVGSAYERLIRACK